MGSQAQLSLLDDFSFYEGVDTEYKAASGGLPTSLWESYSAFANSGGGTIWLGIAEVDGLLKVSGVLDPHRLRTDIYNLANNRQKVSANLLSEDAVEIIDLDSPKASIIRIRVPRASRRERPVYVGSNPFQGTFRRNHQGDYRCSEDEVRRMFADQSEEPADSRILEGFGLDDLHQESLRQFRVRFSAAFPNHPWLFEDDASLLVRLGGFRRDRHSHRDGLTLAGLLMFGREEAIRDPAAVPAFQLDYRERLGEASDVRWTDRVTLDGTWEGNLFQFYQRVMLRLGDGPGIKRPFQRDAEGYRRSSTAVHEALQEALVNALIHADYAGQGGIVIDRYPDRFEFSNPGSLLLSREQLIRGGISECRNRSLQKMFQMLGAGDKAGSGIDKIRMSWLEQRWQSPRIGETVKPDRVQLVLPMISTLPEDAMLELTRRFGNVIEHRSGDEIQALVTAAVEGSVTNQRLQDMLVLHSVDITRMLQALVRDGLLRQEGKTRGTRYLLQGKSPDLEGSSPDLEGSSPDLEGSSPDLEGSSPDLETTSDDTALAALAAPVRDRGKAPRELVRRVIVDLCRDRFLKLRDLAQLMDRSPDTLREGYIAEMVETGDLELRYPEHRNHPDQAYRSKPGI